MAEAEDNTLELDAPLDADLEIPPVETEDDADELVISFDGEEAGDSEEETSEGWKKVRGEIRSTKQELAEARAKLAALEAPAIVLGPKPTLESCDYDGDAFEAALDTWKDKERTAKETQTAEQKQAEAFRTEFQADLATAQEQEAALKVPDFKEAMAEVVASLNDNQQAVLIQASKNKANVIYALGKHPARLTALAAITNPIKLAVAINELERGLTMTSRRRSPEPETIVRGSAPLSKAGPDKERERLAKEADKPGADRGALMRYDRAQRERLAAKRK